MSLKMRLLSKKPHTTNKVAVFLKYVGPGLLITVGFIDPGNWASNIAAGSQYGYSLLWMVTLSTIMGVKIIGTDVQAINRAENRDSFEKIMVSPKKWLAKY